MKELKRYFSYLGTYKIAYWGVFLFTMLASIILGLATPYMNKMIFNALEYSDITMFFKAVVICIVLAILNCLSPYCRYFQIKIVRKVVFDIKIKLFDKLMGMNMNYYDKHHSGDVLKTLNWDANSLKDSYFTHVYRVAARLVGGITSLIAMLIYSPILACISLVFCGLTVYVTISINKIIKRMDKDIQAKVAKLATYLSDILSGFTLLKMYRGSSRVVDNFNSENEEVTAKEKEKVENLSQMEMILFLLDIISGFGTIAVGTYMVSSGKLDYGTVMAIVTLQMNVGFMMQGFGSSVTVMTSSLVKAGRVFDFLEMEGEEPLEDRSFMGIEEMLIPVVAENVTFFYEDKEVLKDFTIMVYPKEKLVIKGQSGCGKSTFLKILLGFYQKESGNIKLFDHHIEQYSLYQLRQMITYVPQNNYLFEGTIFDNIAYGYGYDKDVIEDEFLREDVIKAAKMAYADEFIAELPGGYDTHVDAGGTNFSGGQRQRIAIARAFLKQSPIVLMDEHSSALDVYSEKMINRAIKELMNNRVVIMVSHNGNVEEYVDRTVEINA